MTDVHTGAESRDAAEVRGAPDDTVAHCRTMADVRRHIDRIDRDVVALLAERAGYVRQAARIKPGREDIVDPSRIEDVIGKVRRTAQQYGLEPDLVDAVYRLVIDRFIAQEAAEFERLHGVSGDNT